MIYRIAWYWSTLLNIFRPNRHILGIRSMRLKTIASLKQEHPKKEEREKISLKLIPLTDYPADGRKQSQHFKQQKKRQKRESQNAKSSQRNAHQLQIISHKRPSLPRISRFYVKYHLPSTQTTPYSPRSSVSSLDDTLPRETVHPLNSANNETKPHHREQVVGGVWYPKHHYHPSSSGRRSWLESGRWVVSSLALGHFRVVVPVCRLVGILHVWFRVGGSVGYLFCWWLGLLRRRHTFGLVEHWRRGHGGWK